MTNSLILSLITLLAGFSATSGQLEFRDSPASVTVLANFPTVLTCTYTEPVPSSILWEMGGSQVLQDNPRVSTTFDGGTGRSELRIAIVRYGDAGEYACRALDASRVVIATSQSATITVQGIPVFVSPLFPGTISLGGTLALECQVLSNPNATISWSYELSSNRVSLTTGGRVTISPANHLTISNVQVSDAGYYVCTAENIFGMNMTSGRLLVGGPDSPVEVTITPSSPFPLVVREGDSATLSCMVSAAVPISTITWTRSSGNPVTGVTQITNGLILSVSSAGKESSDLYTCTATDATGTRTSQSIEITVTTPPEFVEEPDDVTGVVDMPLESTLSCSAVGDPPPVITWLRPDLSPLPVDALTNSPRFLSLRRDDEGTYTCLAANSAGEIRTQFTITVQGVPLISISQSAVTTPPGQDVTFRCLVSGSPAPSSPSWSREDGRHLTNSSITIGASLVLFGVSSMDAGTYICVSSNSFGSSMAQVQLTIPSNPIISSVTASPVIISANSLLILNCTGSGPPETSTNWYLNGARLDPESDSNVMVQADGMLIVSDASISYTGTYFCNVSTSFAFVLSSVEVIVGVNPTILTPPRDIDLVPGMETTLDCRISGFPTPHSSWFKTDPVSGQREELGVIGPSHIQLSTGLQLRNVSGNDSGMYECVAENAIGRIVERATVRVEGSPVAISIQPTVFSTNTSATLTCLAPLNFPPGDFSWTSQDGAPLFSGRFSVSESGALSISPVLLQDAMDITCTVVNRYGESSVTTTIQVLFPPTVTVTGPSDVIILDSKVILTCDTQGEPPPVIGWTNQNGLDAREEFNTMVDSIAGTLTFSGVAASNIGIYTCTATNSLGSASDTFMVVVRGEAVPGLSATVMSTTTVLIEWSELPFDTQNNLVNYQLHIRRAGREELLVDQIFSLFERRFTTSDLSPGLSYEVTVRGFFGNDVIGLNSTILITTQEDVPSGPPLNLEATPLENGIFMEWSLPEEDNRNGIIVSYIIEYQLTPGSSDQAENFITETLIAPNLSDDNVTYSLANLEGDRSYDVRVTATTAVGNGPPTDVLTVITLQARINRQQAVSIAIGVGVSLGGVAMLVVIVMSIYLARVIYRRKTKEGKHEPLVAAERERKRDKKERKRKTQVQ